jgi:glutamate-5-semialdehyde dehydrogenase
MKNTEMKAKEALKASISMANVSYHEKNDALESIADSIWNRKRGILEANRRDLEVAEKMTQRNEINQALLQRLYLDEAKLGKIVDMVRSIANLPDPIGKTTYSMELDEGLELYRVTAPVGVICFIFESRPDALVQIASLCLKSGNSCLLKGGSEAQNSNRYLFEVIKEAGDALPDGWIQLLEARKEVRDVLTLNDYVNLVIPRGSNDFVRYIQDNTRIPVLGHSEGVCHIYVDSEVDASTAIEVCYDSKVQYPAVCNAVDCVLIHNKIAETFLPSLVDRFHDCRVQFKGDSRVQSILNTEVELLTKSDYGKEYLDYILALRIVDTIEEAIDFINSYGSHHTDAILTLNQDNANRFMEMVDSASVFWNASTRFSDGYRYGLGAEVGISTGKIHARGPTGLEGLISYKYYLKGEGHTVAEYMDDNKRRFKHRKMAKKWSKQNVHLQ